MTTRSWSAGLFVVVMLFAMPQLVDAQSAIAGIVRDTTGAVLPGVTVEASSPVLIEKARTVVTDAAGQYKIIDLRPGIYTVTFSLSGFGSTKRDGIVLETNFTAPINIEMKVGELTETITVSGQSPTVDVQTTQRREVLNRDVLDAVPTGRNYQSIGGTLPAVNTGRSDVAGSTAMQQGGLTVYGSLGGDMALEVDGMSVMSSLGSGSTAAVYHNDGAYQEYVYQVSGGTGETQTGGVRINMIPREGGNQFRGDFVALFANTSMQGDNLTDELRARGLTTPAALYQLYDFNASVGGPIVRDRLWFFSSSRASAYNAYVANALNPDGSQAIDDNKVTAFTNRLTSQLTKRNKLTVMYDRLPKWRGHRGLEDGRDPKATYVQTTPLSYDAQVKWTSTVSSKMLLEAGYSTNYYGFTLGYQPDVKRPSATDPFGDIEKTDVLRGTRWNAAPDDFHQPFVAQNLVSAVSYVTGSHALKAGVQYRWSWIKTHREQNGSLTQRYRNGVPDSVVVKNMPVVSASDVNADMGIYVQDSWTMRRLTLNPGLRFEYFNGSVPEQTAPAGRFVPARHFDAIENLPNWKDISPRFGAAFDLFGDSKTAIKGSFGKYVQQEAVGFPERYNPMVSSTDQRTWNDLNKDDIAQDNELGPTTNLAFGIRRNRNPDPDIRRSYQLLYNVGVQQEIRQGVAISANYFRRGFYRLTWTDNLATTFADFTLIKIPDPRGNGQTLDIYNISPAKNGLVDELDTNSANNSRTFNGVDFSLDARLGRGVTMKGGIAIGRTRSITCEVDNPNSLRFCDQTKTGMPFQKQFKMSGVYPLPYGINLSGAFQSTPGLETNINYLVNRSIVPTLTVASITVALNEPNSLYNDRNNQLDFAIAREFRVRGVRVRPQLDLFNALNVSPVVAQVTAFGSSLGNPQRILDARLVRIGLQVHF